MACGKNLIYKSHYGRQCFWHFPIEKKLYVTKLFSVRIHTVQFTYSLFCQNSGHFYLGLAGNVPIHSGSVTQFYRSPVNRDVPYKSGYLATLHPGLPNGAKVARVRTATGCLYLCGLRVPNDIKMNNGYSCIEGWAGETYIIIFLKIFVPLLMKSDRRTCRILNTYLGHCCKAMCLCVN